MRSSLMKLQVVQIQVKTNQETFYFLIKCACGSNTLM
jgi:hypothetical protein